MRTLIIASGLLGIAAAAVLFALKLTALGMPVSRTLESSDGRTIDVTIVGKRDSTIVFERADDGSRWDLPIDRLSLKDRIFVMRLPDQDPPPQRKPVAPKDPFIASREALISDLEKKRAIIQSELASRTLNETIDRRRREELAAVGREIRQLELSIKSYRYRTKRD